MNDLDADEVNFSNLENELSYCDDLNSFNYQFGQESSNRFFTGRKLHSNKINDVLTSSRVDTNHSPNLFIAGGYLKEKGHCQTNLIENSKDFDFSSREMLPDNLLVGGSNTLSHLSVSPPIFENNREILNRGTGTNWTAQSDMENSMSFDTENYPSSIANLLNTNDDLKYLTDNRFNQDNYLADTFTVVDVLYRSKERDVINFNFLTGQNPDCLKFRYGGLDSSWSTPSTVKDLITTEIENNPLVVNLSTSTTTYGLGFSFFNNSEFSSIENRLESRIFGNDFTHFPKDDSILSNNLLFPVPCKYYQRNVKFYDYDEDFLEELSKINNDLVKIYKGAIEINCNKPSDYKRHVANGFRELISNTIRDLSPHDNVLKEWLLKTNRKQLLYIKNEKQVPTRKAKLIYIFRDYTKRERKLVEDEIRCINGLYNIFNGPTHNLTTDISGKLLDNYIQKVKNSLKTLIILFNN